MHHGIEQKVITAAARKILFLPHAIEQMSHPGRMITTDEARECVLSGEVIEKYPQDPRGERCPMMHGGRNRVIHVVCAPKEEYLAIITAYPPSPDQWLPERL
uniref:DUF4258 domain-containing protein n=1 Tax=Candidatus Kentrum sp. FM TaxID=2126340 RepID=A0A450RTX7_9GAMM|nr:MAG: protein of unknown function (DUF4258) [Candidatus Kentron sp. FM]VFJ43384.1 MAG: protein of unknown function (DUF4258) [Candidatus Kentron sp. FM]VFK05525.1 MAG: protein of unknown function (DUF4258) [Candidatus Kentron sp. FM]